MIASMQYVSASTRRCACLTAWDEVTTSKYEKEDSKQCIFVGECACAMCKWTGREFEKLKKAITFSFVSSYYLLVVVMMFVDVEIA